MPPSCSRSMEQLTHTTATVGDELDEITAMQCNAMEFIAYKTTGVRAQQHRMSIVDPTTGQPRTATHTSITTIAVPTTRASCCICPCCIIVINNYVYASCA